MTQYPSRNQQGTDMHHTRLHHIRQWLAATLTLLCVAANATSPNALIVFGDSLSDQGLVWQQLQNTTGQNLPQAPYYFDGRFSNGPVAVEYMALALGVPLDDRAWGGATTGRSNFLNKQGELAQTGLLDQVDGYVLAHGAHSLDSQSLYVLWAGANDMIFSPNQATADKASQQMMQALDTLYAAGARNFFVPLMPELSRMPTFKGLSRLFQPATEAYNQSLTTALRQASAKHPDAAIQSFDTVNYLSALLAAPGTAFADTSTACVKGTFENVISVCANPQDHVYWDGTHFTTGLHARLGTAFAAAVPETASGTQMVWGLGGLGSLLWRARVRRTRRRERATQPD
ncbi:MAG TPA: SGNH/GDSL hydrolase family protein [Aquabacterium sp.]|uniref:SGNH/GDSL hydrolase family protein n=1 Tax=Aquabacterium sp. TaxID=1872578 RepID=UPI002E343CF1|nr:SGNH/GDSL hydrolase family protein [Aquabacterium sp.]HEX5356086.1 SGNH/GDSL hydrolase family protein [Aquabacterium sp.]